MLYANSPEGYKIAASRGAVGVCPGCDDKLIAKCGELVIHHWSHYARPDCDNWFEPETDWHRGWKAHFSPRQVEVVIGPHRADVVARSTVLEFQHSGISTTEIRERESFYTQAVGRMAWVFDANDFREHLDFRFKKTWTDLPPMIGFQATEVAEPRTDMARCTCGAWRLWLAYPASSWAPCWQCGTNAQPREIAAPRVRADKSRYATFVWKHRRRSHGAVAAPLFWDLGNGWLFHVITLHFDRTAAGFGRFVTRDYFVTWYGGQIDDGAQEHATSP